MGNEMKLGDMKRNAAINMQSQNDSFKNKIHIYYGAIAGGFLIALFVLYYLQGWTFEKSAKSWIPSVVFMLIIVIAQFKHTRAVNDSDTVSFGNLFAKGFKTAAVGTCIYIIFLVLFILLDPTYKHKMMELSRERMMEKGMDIQQIKNSIENTKQHFLAYSVSGGVMGELFLGLIASLAGAAAAPKNKEPKLKPLS